MLMTVVTVHMKCGGCVYSLYVDDSCCYSSHEVWWLCIQSVCWRQF